MDWNLESNPAVKSSANEATSPLVLIVDDEAPIVEALAYQLWKDGFNVVSAGSGEEALQVARATQPDLVILDLMLPGVSGLHVCEVLRGESEVPIIMLTAKGGEEDLIMGLDLGADDYLTKPFSMRELAARVRAVLRRHSATTRKQRTIRFADIEIDQVQHRVSVRNDLISLSPKEFKLLCVLAAHLDQVLSRETLLERVWGRDAFVDGRTVDVHIRWLRMKIEQDPGNPRRIRTIRGFGYKLVSE